MFASGADFPRSGTDRIKLQLVLGASLGEAVVLVGVL